MAELKKKMAFSPKTDNNPQMEQQVQCHYLFHHQFCLQKPYNTLRHMHPSFWHIDIITMDDVALYSNTGMQYISAGQFALIPAHVAHEFRYSDPGTEWLSIKFECSGVPHPTQSVVITPSEIEQKLLESICTLAQSAVLSVTDSTTIEHLLAALLTQVIYTDDHRAHKPSFVDKVENFLAIHSGKDLSVTEVARELGYSPGHASYCMQRECGVSLKAFIDQQRVATAERLLNFTDISISEIARQLNFPDVYAFSRFFHRMKGTCPRTFR
ncbi:MAG: AraC family transcriptional regulator, partial [bacterium]